MNLCYPRVAVLAVLSSVLFSGSLVSAQDGLQYPLSIAVSESTVYLADRELPGVWKVQGDALSLFFRGEKKFRTPLNAVRCVEIDRDGKLLAGDSSTREVYRFDDAGKPVPLTNGGVGIPMDIAVNQAGDLFVSDLEIQRVVKVPKAGGEPTEVAEIAGCRGLFIDHEDHLWVVSTTTNQLHRIAPDRTKKVILEGRPLNFPHTVVVDQELTAYVCDGYEKGIWKIPLGGQPTLWVKGPPFDNPVGMAWQGDTILVVDPRAKGVFQVNKEGQVMALPLKPAAG